MTDFIENWEQGRGIVRVEQATGAVVFCTAQKGIDNGFLLQTGQGV
ncbi:TPA: hypothetical protein ACKFAD_002634 [Citrobacter koseri]